MWFVVEEVQGSQQERIGDLLKPRYDIGFWDSLKLLGAVALASVMVLIWAVLSKYEYLFRRKDR